MERQTSKPEATFSSTTAGPSGALGARGGRGVDRGGRSPIPGDSAGVHRVGTVRQTRGQLRPPDSEAPANSGAAEAHVHGMRIAKTAGDKARASNGAAEEEP